MEMKERIQQKATDLFRKYGIRSITMDEIAAQLAVSKKTIYQFFADKDELVDAVIGNLIHYAQDCCTNDRKGAKDAVEEIFMAMEFVKEMFSNMNPVLLFDLERAHPNAFKKFQEHKAKYLLKLIRDNLERGIREELYRVDLNIDVLSKLRLENMMISFNQEIFPAGKYNLADTQQIIIEHYVFGIASLKGYKQIVKYKEVKSPKSKPV
ncbi:MAG TPA: TetR/AcrR family transcriptional regulator [Flavitalea sp.]|nr:TetR/AcrR family transcriptional regulator [Flavitalea sp.]